MKCLYCQSNTELSSDTALAKLYVCTNCPIYKIKFWISSGASSPYRTTFLVRIDQEIYYLHLDRESTKLTNVTILTSSNPHNILELNYRLEITPTEAMETIARLLNLKAFS